MNTKKYKLLPLFALGLFAISAYASNYAYTLTETEDTSSGVIATKYVLNSATGELEAVDYVVGFDTLSSKNDSADTTYTWGDYNISLSTSGITSKTIRVVASTVDANWTRYCNGISETNGGAAIYVSSAATSITGVFTGNHTSRTGSIGGGAIYTVKNIGTLNGVFVSNYTTGNTGLGGALQTSAASTITNLYGIFIGNYTSGANAHGGAIYNAGTISAMEANFISNYVKTGSGGAIYNTGTMSGITGDFISNYVTTNSGGAIYNTGTITGITGDFISNYATAGSGGAIYNASGSISSIQGSFMDNTANSDSGLGGAVYVAAAVDGGTSSVGFVAKTDNTTFAGNTDSTGSNAIYNAGTVTFDAYGYYSINVYDGISGSSTSDGTMIINSITDGNSAFSTVGFYNTVKYQDITVSAGTLALGSIVIDGTGYSANLSSSSLTVSSGATLSFVVSPSVNDDVNSITLGTITDISSASFALDLSAIFNSDFTLTINLGTDDVSTLYSFLTSDLDVIFSDGILTAAESEGDYAYEVLLDGETLAEFDISTGDTYITISGTSYATAVPEPSTYAMILGVLAMGFAYYRKRK